MAKKSFVKLYIWILRSTGSVPYPEKQWGRKDAFPGADGSTITQVNPNAETIPIYGATSNLLIEGTKEGLNLVDIFTSGIITENTSLNYSIKNPLTFIYGGTIYDWYTTNATYQNNALWGDGGKKSTFDPCPHGWRIAADGTWNDFSVMTAPYYILGTPTTIGNNSETCGILYYRNSWYPACGYRTCKSGTLTAVGNNGDYWSSNTLETFSLLLNFTMNEVFRPNYANSRGYSISIRCIQE